MPTQHENNWQEASGRANMVPGFSLAFKAVLKLVGQSLLVCSSSWETLLYNSAMTCINLSIPRSMLFLKVSMTSVWVSKQNFL